MYDQDDQRLDEAIRDLADAQYGLSNAECYAFERVMLLDIARHVDPLVWHVAARRARDQTLGTSRLLAAVRAADDEAS